MDTEHDLSDGLGLTVLVETGRPLAELTTLLNTLCDRAEDRVDRTVLVLRISSKFPEDRTWPNGVDIRTVNRWERALHRLRGVAGATIWAASGTCAGAALDLLLAADFRICTADLRVLLPINDGHFWPGMAIHALLQHVGMARARQIVLWGEDISAQQAHEFALVDRMADDLDTAVHEAAVLLGRVADSELAVRRMLLAEAPSTSFDEALGVHLAACDRELRRLRTHAAVPSEVRGQAR